MTIKTFCFRLFGRTIVLSITKNAANEQEIKDKFLRREYDIQK